MVYLIHFYLLPTSGKGYVQGMDQWELLQALCDERASEFEIPGTRGNGVKMVQQHPPLVFTVQRDC
jgi:hypothetical protein